MSISALNWLYYSQHQCCYLGIALCKWSIDSDKFQMTVTIYTLKLQWLTDRGDMFTPGGYLRNLLCFVPGLDRRKAWHPSGELQTLVRAASKDAINTKRLSKRQHQYYGSSSSDEDDGFGSEDDGDACSPAFMKLEPREMSSDKLGATAAASVSVPDIVVHTASDDCISEINDDKSHSECQSIYTSSSEEETPSGEAEVRSEWVSPMNTRKHSLSSEPTGTELESPSHDSTVVRVELSATPSLTGSLPSNSAGINENLLDSGSSRRSSSDSTANASTCSNISRKHATLGPVVVHQAESSSLSQLCNIDDCPETDILSDASENEDESSMSGAVATSTPKHKTSMECDTSSPALNHDSTSTSSSSHLLSYVSAPRIVHQATEDTLSDTTSWWSDSDEDDGLNKIISRDPSQHTLQPEHSHTSQAGQEVITPNQHNPLPGQQILPPNQQTEGMNPKVEQTNSGNGAPVITKPQQLFLTNGINHLTTELKMASPISPVRINPFNTPEKANHIASPSALDASVSPINELFIMQS